MTEGNEYVAVEKRKERLARIRREKKEKKDRELQQLKDDYLVELDHYKPEVVIGIDEVGTGALAGPVVIAAVVMNPYAELDVKDSKAYDYYPKKRLEAFQRIECSEVVLFRLTETVEAAELIEYGQGPAMEKGYSRLVNRVIKALEGEYSSYLVVMDGKVPIQTAAPQVTVIKGDAIVTAISAASVIAKITRDGMMFAAHQKYPNYNFGKHKGYGTKDHMSLLELHGPCDLHRTYIARIKKAIEKRNG